MKRRFRNFDEGGEVDDPRRRGVLRDSQGNVVRSGTGEPVRAAGEYTYEDYRRDNPQQVREDEEKAKQTAAEIRQRMQRDADQVRPPAEQPPQARAGQTPPDEQVQVFAPLGGVPPASSQSRPPGAMPPASPPQPAAMPPAGMPPPMQMGDASVAQAMAQRGPQAAPPTPAPRPPIEKPKTPMAVSSGRGKAAGKTAEQEMQSILEDKKRQQERERIKNMERKQALEGVYPEMAIPALRGVRALAGMASGKTAGQAATKAATKAARAEPKVPSDLGAKPRAERTFASEARTGSRDLTAEPARTGSRELARQAESGSKAVAKRAEPAPAKIAERAKDRGFVPGERRALEGRKPGQLQEARQGESRREKYMGPAQEVRRELPKPATKEVAKPQRKKPRKDEDDDISRFEGESGAIRSGLRPGKKRFRKDDDPMGRFAGESPAFMKKGGMVRRGDGIAQRGKTRGKYI